MLLNKKQVEDIKRKDADMNDGQQNKHPQEEEIDLLELALKVWAERRWILKYCGGSRFDCSFQYSQGIYSKCNDCSGSF